MKLLKRNNHRIRGVCFDLDGTLIDEANGRIPENTIQALKRIKGGRKLYFATGRNLAEIPKEILELPFDGFVLLSGLATYIKPDKSTAQALENYQTFQQFKKLASSPLEWTKVASVLSWLEQTRLSAVFYLLDQIFLLSSDKTIEQVGINPNWGEVEHFTDCKSFKIAHPEVFRIEILIPDQCNVEFLDNFEMEEIVCFEGGLVSLKKNLSKREGMIPILREDWIPRQSLLYVGNGVNDLELLDYVGYSCAMSDASDPEVMRNRDYIAPPVEKGGIIQCLKYFKLF